MACRRTVQSNAVFDCAAFGVAGAEIEAPDPCEGDGRRAHGAGLKRNVEVAACQALGREKGTGAANDKYFGVCRRVVQFASSVSGPGNHLSIPADRGSHGHLAALGSLARLVKRLRHGHVWVVGGRQWTRRHGDLTGIVLATGGSLC